MLSKCRQKTQSKARICDLVAALIETFEAFEQPTLITTLASMASEGANKKGQERENADAKRKNDWLYAVRAELNFLLIKISNLTPECAVFNETARRLGWARIFPHCHECHSYKTRYTHTHTHTQSEGKRRERKIRGKKKSQLIWDKCMKVSTCSKKLTV